MRQGEARIEMASARIAFAAMGMHAEPGPVPIHLYDQESLALLLGVSKKRCRTCIPGRLTYCRPPLIFLAPGGHGGLHKRSLHGWMAGRYTRQRHRQSKGCARLVGRGL